MTQAAHTPTNRKLTVTVHYEFDFTDSLNEMERDTGVVEDIEEFGKSQLKGYDFNKDITRSMEIKVDAATDVEYVQSAGEKCPYCGSGNLDPDTSANFLGSELSYKVGCGDCEKEWTDLYKLKGYLR